MFDIREKLVTLDDAYAELYDQNATSFSRDEVAAIEAEIIAEFDRLRWHYPERGELPKEDDNILAEASDVDNEFWIGEYNGNDEVFIESCKRWRYIE